VNTISVSQSGRQVAARCVDVDGVTIVATNRYPRIAAVHDEAFVVAPIAENPERFVTGIARSRLRADLFTFVDDICDPRPRFPYYFDRDNLAAVDTRSFDQWWSKLPQATRKNCRRSERRGAHADVVTLDESLAREIKDIYDETPIRQGRRFWHYGKNVATVWRENATYLDRSDFIVLRCSGELIGFMKLVYVGRFAKIMQILAKASHYDKRPMNALIAKAVELCSERGVSHLIYSKFQYGNNASSSMIEFKIRNGFERLDFPRYFVPMTLQGRVALSCRLHRGLQDILPAPVIDTLLRLRESTNTWRLRRQGGASGADHRDESA
jgi:hypothetical protein